MALVPRVVILASAGLAIGLAGGCNDNQFGIEKRHPNQPPQTVLSSGPPDSTYGTHYKAHLFWSGSDADGTIDHYDFILVDHPAIDDSIAAADPHHRVAVTVPAPDDPRWTPTSATDSIFVTRADTLRDDPVPPPHNNDGDLERHDSFIRRQSFERWHTFFVRAVDNEGLPDPTPDYRSFNSRNIAPFVYLQPPVHTRSEFSAPPTIVFNWDGSDDEGDGTVQPPIASRWTIVATRRTFDQYAGFPDTLYALPRSAWSRWRAWGAHDGSGKQAIVANLRPANGERNVGFYIFAVQAMDEGGAVTPVFDDLTEGRNNATRVFVTGDVGPMLTLREPDLGPFNFTGVSRPVQVVVAAGQPIHFCWRGDASAYGGSIVGYRYGWDIRNPDDEAQWEQNWSETATCANVRIFTTGTHIFFLETRDNAESITRARMELTVQQLTRNRDLLIVDDTIQPQGDNDPREAIEDQRWLTIVDSLRAERPFVFDPVRDVYDVHRNANQKPPISLLFDYKTVVWNVVPSSNGSGLGRLARFVDPFVEGQNSTATFNYLNLYLDNGGQLWIAGDQPSFVLWPIVDNRPLNALVPVNITAWNADVHPGEDSVGVNSLLYRMGVEMVDLGNGGNVPAPRFDRLDQGCIGFRRAGGPGGGSQTYPSSLAQSHAHQVEIPGADVDLPPADGATYVTTLQSGHTHTVHLTHADLLALRRGDPVSVQTSESPLPAPHTHRFDLFDRTGRWGAPAFLEPDATNWPSPPANVNRFLGRVQVEIYNMPNLLARQQPPLVPPTDRVLSLYEFASATPAAPERGFVYSATADGQPAILLARRSVVDRFYSRAYCGFELWRLSFKAHLRLAEFILLRHLHVGSPELP